MVLLGFGCGTMLFSLTHRPSPTLSTKWFLGTTHHLLSFHVIQVKMTSHVPTSRSRAGT